MTTPKNRVVMISLRQPWATLLALGEKERETRGWKMREEFIGCTFVIHAAKTFDQFEQQFANLTRFRRALQNHGYNPNTLPLGAAVGFARCEDCRRTEEVVRVISEQERQFGDYGPARWASRFSNFNVFAEPIPCRGSIIIQDWNQSLYPVAAILG